MIYIIKAHKKQKEARRTAAALEVLLDIYDQRCRKLQEGTKQINNHLEKDQPDDRKH